MNDQWICNGKAQLFPKKNIEKYYADHYAYEVIRLIDGEPVFLPDHYQRLVNTCKHTGIKTLPSLKVLTNEISTLSQINCLGNINIKIIISEGSRAIFAIPSIYPKKDEYLNGVNCNFLHQERQNPSLKIYHAAQKNLFDKKKKEAGVYESILVNNRGLITEGSKSNIFFIKDKILYTAPDTLVLPGITRQKIIDICSNLNISLKFQAVKSSGISQYSAAFLCGTSPAVLPIRKIEKIVLEHNHPLVQQIHAAYHKLLFKH